MFNPFDWVSGPSLGPFGSVLKTPLGIILGLVWALCLVYAVVHLVMALGQLASARREHRGDDAETAAKRIIWPAAAIIALFAAPAIYAVLAGF